MCLEQDKRGFLLEQDYLIASYLHLLLLPFFLFALQYVCIIVLVHRIKLSALYSVFASVITLPIFSSCAAGKGGEVINSMTVRLEKIFFASPSSLTLTVCD